MLEQSDVNEILTMARVHYRRGVGRANLLYYPPLDTDAKRDRNFNATQASFRLGLLRTLFAARNESMWGRGKMLAADRSAAGNCEEMSLLVVHFCHMTESFLHKVAQIFLVGTHAPGSMVDHAFVLVTDSTATPNWSAATIRQMTEAGTGLWIIDAWLDVACPANLYYGHILSRLYYWRTDTLGISDGSGLQVDDDGSPIATWRSTHRYESYSRNLVNSPLEFKPARMP
jgi:hypothetical protein